MELYHQTKTARPGAVVPGQALTDGIGARLDTLRQMVSKSSRRFYIHRLSGFEDRPRGGRPAHFPLLSESTSKRWLVNCRRVAACRWRAGEAVRRSTRPHAATQWRARKRYWNATSAKLRSLRECKRSDSCDLSFSSAFKPISRCWP